MLDPDVEKELRRVLELVRARGLSIDRLQELQKMRLPRAVVPALVMVLPTVKTPEVRATIVSALTDPAARGIAAKPLMRELERAKAEGNELLAWQIGNALCAMADDSIGDELLEASRDRQLGDGRKTLVEALGRLSKRPNVVASLTEALGDPLVQGQAVRALGKLVAWETKELVKPFEEHPMPWIRVEARKAVARMDNAQGKELVARGQVSAGSGQRAARRKKRPPA